MMQQFKRFSTKCFASLHAPHHLLAASSMATLPSSSSSNHYSHSKIASSATITSPRFSPFSPFITSSAAVSAASGSLTFSQRMRFSSVWGERTMKWIEEKLHEHMEAHQDDYTFNVQDIPFLRAPTEYHKDKTRFAIVTPCIKQATSSYLIDNLLARGYHVTGVADPTANINVIQSRFKIKDANITTKQEQNGTNVTIVDNEENPALYVEQRPLQTFGVKENQLEKFSVVFDEMPLLEVASDESVGDNRLYCHTTAFGHALAPGGVIYLQTEGAKKYNEKVALINRIKGYYPESHFVLVDTRKTPFTRQFLFMKVGNTIGKGQ